MKRLALTIMILASFTLGGVAQSVSFDFEDGTLQGWTTLDADGDGHCWEPSIGGMGHNSNGMALSYSRDYATGDSLAPNEYLVSPRLVLNEDYSLISLWVIPLDESQPAEHWALSISTTVNDDPMAFTTLQEWTLTFNPFHPGEWTQYSVDLTQYAGQEVYVAIRHFFWEGFETSQSAICVDDIEIDGTLQQEGLVITPSTLTFEAFPESHTVNIMNDTDAPITINSAHVDQNDLWVMFWDLSSLPMTLQPGQSIDFELYLNAYGYKGYFSATAVFETSIGNRYLPININEEAWDDGLLVMPMQGLYFNEQEPLTQYFYLHNTNALQSITVYEVSEGGSNYFNMVPSHELPYVIPGGGSFEVTATLVNFPENAMEANLYINSSDGEINSPFFHIAGGLTPSSGELMVTPDTLWVTDVYIYQKYFTITNETDHDVTISSIYTEDTIVSLSHYDPAYGLVNVDEVLPVTLEPGDSFEIKTDIQNIILPLAKRNNYIVSPIHIVSTEGEDEVIMMIDEASLSFGLIAYQPFYMLDSYDPVSFSLVNAEWSGSITITGIEEKDTDYLDISTDVQFPLTLENYGDYLRGSLKCKDTFANPGFVSTRIIVHTSIGDFEPIGVDIYGELFVSPFSFNPEWYFEIQNGNGSITYQYLYQAGDTIVNDDPAHILVRVNTLYDKDTHTEVTHEYVYESDGKVYWWNKTLEEFTLLYDFKADVGDEWEIKVGTETLAMHVDAVDYIELEDVFYRVQHVSDPDDLFSGDIICGIGHLTSFFPEKLMDNGEGMRVDGLRCYWLEDELVFHLGDENCDAIYSDIHGIEEDGPSTGSGTLLVYPNPTDGVLVIETHDRASLQGDTYRISNMMGQVLLQGQIMGETQQIDVTALPEGMYFITVGEGTRKFVVNR